ncbi:MAG: AbrB/MazE/SpoVT family DNA-binding domain-containing protein [Ruminococcaceae bacterium]|nr:AbrB/MazE/SpoVT family DNA-binding domain-containing protein [Oscillospiraceae bacterium]
MKDAFGQQLYMGSAKVGPKGQIVIPKEVREMFGIEPGDNVIILADANRGIAIERTGFFRRVADAAFDRNGITYSDLSPIPAKKEDDEDDQT